jgi:hypothetical protein
MMGFCVSLSKLMALTEHAGTHLRQPKHFSGSSSTPPPGRFTSAAAGHASAQAGASHPRHTIATKFDAMPPVVRIFIALFVIEWLFWFATAHTFAQLRHPMHLFIPTGFII